MFAKLLTINLTNRDKPSIEFAGGVDPLSQCAIDGMVTRNTTLVVDLRNSPAPIPDHLTHEELIREVIQFLEARTDHLIFTDELNPFFKDIINFYCFVGEPKFYDKKFRDTLRTLLPLFNDSTHTPATDYGSFLSVALSQGSLFSNTHNLYFQGVEGLHTGFGNLGGRPVRIIGTMMDLTIFRPDYHTNRERVLALSQRVEDPLHVIAKILVDNGLSVNHYTQVLAKIDSRRVINIAPFSDIRECSLYRIDNMVKVVYQIKGFHRSEFSCLLEDIVDIFDRNGEFNLGAVRDMLYIDTAVKSIRQLLRDLGDCNKPLHNQEFRLTTDMQYKLFIHYRARSDFKRIYPRRRRVSRWLKHLGF